MNTQEFFAKVYGENPDGTILLSRSNLKKDGSGTWYSPHTAQREDGKTYPHAVADRAMALNELTKPGESVYHRITLLARDWVPNCNLTKPKCQAKGECRAKHRGEAVESTWSPGLFFDADVSTGDHKDGIKPADWAEFRVVLDKAGMPPETSLVFSGGGFYPGWLHPELVDVSGKEKHDRYLAMQKGLHGLVNAWSLHLGAGKLDSTFDLARVLRVPGTHNKKPKYGPDGVLTSVVHFDGDRYTLEELEAVLAAAEYPPGHFPHPTRAASGRMRSVATNGEPVEGELLPVTEVQGWDRINVQLDACRSVKMGEGANGVMGGAARVVGRYIGVLPNLDVAKATSLLVEACRDNPYQDPLWYGQGANWTIEDVVEQGLENGLAEPRRFALVATTAETLPAGTPAARPPLRIGTTASMMSWLQDNMGREHLSGMFNRGGAVVYTPVVGSEGYVAPAAGDDDSGMQVRPMAKISLAAHVQFSHQCFAVKEDKDGNEERVEAQFPAAAAEYAISAASLMPHLRPLRGVTHTPIMRSDGTILDRPGYDDATGLLYAPAVGLAVDEVERTPSAEAVAGAVAQLTGMVADFPFVTDSDRANWLGMMLTPLLREVVTSDRKMFAINAHQAGSGKTLLAELAMYTHGAVFRSTLPEDETEMRKWVTGTLSTTTAPIVIADNVTGTLRSAFLAGVLTSRTLTDRVLGKSENVDLKQDRMWVITGNNVQIGADISRRLVTIAIDPDVERPEERTGFAIENLVEYAIANRGATLHALLTLMRHWVVSGRPMPRKKQSDSFTDWESAVTGILATAGVAGEFNASVTKTKVKDVDREDWADFLGKLYRIFGDQPFYLGDLAKRAVANPEDTFAMNRASQSEGWDSEAKEVLTPLDMPTSRLAEQLAAGRLSLKSLGSYMGPKTDARHGGFVLRSGAKDRKGVPWRVEGTADAIARLAG